MSKLYDVIIIGAGPVFIGRALAGRAGLATHHRKAREGGQIVNTADSQLSGLNGGRIRRQPHRRMKIRLAVRRKPSMTPS